MLTKSKNVELETLRINDVRGFPYVTDDYVCNIKIGVLTMDNMEDVLESIKDLMLYHIHDHLITRDSKGNLVTCGSLREHKKYEPLEEKPERIIRTAKELDDSMLKLIRETLDKESDIVKLAREGKGKAINRLVGMIVKQVPMADALAVKTTIESIISEEL